MKKILPVLIAILLLLTVCSCGLAGTKKKVLEVDNAQLNSAALKHAFDLDNDTIVSVIDQKKGDKKTVTFCNTQYHLEYNRTISYLIGETVVDEYGIVGTDKGRVLLLPNGDIYAVLGLSVGHVDVDGTAEAPVVRNAVEDYLKEVFDFNSFGFCEITESLPDISNGFGLYSFVWYNKIGDIITDQTLKLCVDQNGDIRALWMKYRSDHKFENVSDNLTVNDFHDDIEEKIKSIYGDYLIDYHIQFSKLTRYDGQNCLECTVGVHYREDSDELSEACRLLVIIE